MKIQTGILPQQVTQLFAYSKSDPEILKFTGDKKRFSSLAKFKKWSKDRVIYTLTNRDKDLLGIIWFGLKDNGINFAIRLYPPARGKGYASKFMAKVLKAFQYSPEYKNMGEGPIYLQTRIDNTVAQNLYTKNGWKETGRKDGKIFFEYHH